MAREPTGKTLEESSSESTQATGLKMKDTVEVPYSALMETDTMGSGYAGTLKAMDEWSMRMKTSMRVSGMKGREMGMEF